MEEKQIKVKNSLGTFFICGHESALTYISWQKKEGVSLASPCCAHYTLLQDAARELEDYLAGSRKTFSVPLELYGTEFQKKVWQQLLKIPYGETRSYADVALAINSPKAARAVGSANGKNPICILVPCHRVIASDGRIAGYAGGVDMKKRLLKTEGISC